MGVASYFPPQNYPHVIFDEDSAEVDRFEAGNAYGARATVKQVEMITYAVGFRDSEAAPEEVDINVMLKAELPLGPAEAQAVSASARVVLEGELDLQGAEPVLCRAKYHGARVDSPVVVTGSDCIVFTRLTSAKIVTGGKASRVVASWRRAANASD